MAGPAPPRKWGRVVLVLFGIATGAAAAWLLVQVPRAVQGGPHGLGPNLWGVMGSAVASRPGFTLYSPALRGLGGSWDWEKASRFLRAPRDAVPGTRMAYSGVINPQDRADVLLYLNRQGGSLAPPP